MAQVRMDKKPDKVPSVDDLRETLNELMTMARAFMTSNKFMKPKERAQRLRDLTKAFMAMSRDIEKFKALPMTTPAVKFSFESFRQTYNSFMPRWRRFEADLMGENKD